MARDDEGLARGAAAIVGAATFGIGETPGYSALELAAKAAALAIADAGLCLAEVDAVFGCLSDDMFAGIALAAHLGLRPRLTDNNRTGGSAFMTHVIHAARALQAGACDVALVAYGSNQRSASGGLVTSRRPSAFEAPYAPLTPVSSYALAASRHMHVYGTTRAQLASVAVAARAWANLNPDAFAQGSLTVEDCLSARMVSDPLSARDCCLVTDGAAALVMTRADRARDLPSPPVYVLGGAAAVSHDSIAGMADLTVTAATESGARAFRQAGLRPSDVDVVQLYDAFTINTILFLEDLGFCAKGEGGPLAQSGARAPGGVLPVNTNGGGLSCVHPGMYGLFALVEARDQLAGRAGARQVESPEVALAHGNGLVLSSQATVVLGAAATVQ